MSIYCQVLHVVAVDGCHKVGNLADILPSPHFGCRPVEVTRH
jgi:hypothetical protein